MKIYVDELPKSCEDCPCKDDTYCNLYWKTKKECLNVWDAIFNEERDEQCPLHSLANYTKQVRKEVFEEIRNKIEQAKLVYEWKGKETTIEDILSKI